jgi:hypothetical protein
VVCLDCQFFWLEFFAFIDFADLISCFVTFIPESVAITLVENDLTVANACSLWFTLMEYPFFGVIKFELSTKRLP